MNVACDYEAPMQMLTTEKYIAAGHYYIKQTQVYGPDLFIYYLCTVPIDWLIDLLLCQPPSSS